MRLVEATATSTRLTCDHSLLTCLVDRWRPETHTFHIRWGEMAPTLQDVSYLLGLPLAGDAIGPLQAPADWQEALTLRFQGIRDTVGPLTFEDHGPKLDWLLNFQVSSVSYIFSLSEHASYRVTHTFFFDQCRSKILGIQTPS